MGSEKRPRKPDPRGKAPVPPPVLGEDKAVGDKKKKPPKPWMGDSGPWPMRLLKGLFLCLGLLAYRLCEGQYNDQYMLTAVLCALGLAWAFRHTFRLPFLITGMWIVIMSAWVLSMDRGLHPNVKAAFGYFTLKKTLISFLMVGLAYFVPWTRVVHDRLKLGIALASISTLCGYPILFNTSLNAAFLVALLPLAPGLLVTGLVTAVTLFTQHGSSAYVLLAGVLVWRFRAWGLAGVTLALALKWRAFYSMAVDHYRADFLKMCLRAFWEHGDHWLGWGFGSFEALGPLIQQMNGYTMPQNGIWLSLHNDWAQLLLEGGFVGLAIGAWLFADSIYRLWRADGRWYALFLLGVLGFGYFPLQVPMIALYGTWLIVQAQTKEFS